MYDAMVMDSALGSKIKFNSAVFEANVIVAQRRQSKALVLLRVFRIAYSSERTFEQPHNSRDNLFARQTRTRQVRLDAAANCRQRSSELEHVFIFRSVAHRTPSGMIPILLSSARIATGSLYVAVFRRANPYVIPCRRHGQAADTFERSAVVDNRPIRIAIAEACFRPLAGDAAVPI